MIDTRILEGGLIVSVQAPDGSVVNTAETIAVLARCAEANGAVGVRIEGLGRIAAVRRAVRVPVVGIVKRLVPGYEPYITPTIADVEAIVAAGASIIAFDATVRPRPDGSTVEALVAAIHGNGRIAMADCATLDDARAAAAAGAEICATTLCGYTGPTRGAALPALDLVRALRKVAPFTICEGGISSPALAQAAFSAGAQAIVVGTAITNVDALVSAFVAATPRAHEQPA